MNMIFQKNKVILTELIRIGVIKQYNTNLYANSLDRNKLLDLAKEQNLVPQWIREASE